MTAHNPALQDRFGRRIDYLRLSVTDRCDFRCVYCMAEDMTFLPRARLCTLEELASIARAFVELGTKRIRITGGEPLIRKNILELFKEIGSWPELDELTLTTNGSQLTDKAESLAAANVKRINVSIDSLDPDRFKAITRTGDLSKVLEGLKHAAAVGFDSIKLNSVVLRNRNLDELVQLVEFAVTNSFDISFIEEMPLGQIDDHNRETEFVSSQELRDIIGRHWHLQASGYATGGPSRYWQIGASHIGFISPHSDNFCSTCNRVRVTAEGKLLLCLGNEHAKDLKAVARAYPGQPEKVKAAITSAMHIKPEKHHFTLNDEVEIVRFMNATGG